MYCWFRKRYRKRFQSFANLLYRHKINFASLFHAFCSNVQCSKFLFVQKTYCFIRNLAYLTYKNDDLDNLYFDCLCTCMGVGGGFWVSEESVHVRQLPQKEYGFFTSFRMTNALAPSCHSERMR